MNPKTPSALFESKQEFFSRKELAKLLGCHTETIKRKEKTGLLTPIKLSARTIRYSRQEVIHLLENAQIRNPFTKEKEIQKKASPEISKMDSILPSEEGYPEEPSWEKEIRKERKRISSERPFTFEDYLRIREKYDPYFETMSNKYLHALKTLFIQTNESKKWVRAVRY